MIEGNFIGKATKAEVGTNKDGKPVIRATLEVTEGEHKGKSFNYEGNLKSESIKFTKRDMMALGWKGVDVMRFAEEVALQTQSGKTVPFEVTIAVWNKPDGTVKKWESVRSIGYAAPPLNAIDAEKAKDVNSWFAEAGDIGERAPATSRAHDDIPF